MKRNSGLFLVWMALVALAAVGCNGRYIGSTGLHRMHLGDPLPAQGTPRLMGHAARDTFEQQGDYQWRSVVMEYRKGNVYVEEDFFGSDQVARIRVYTPELSLRNGLKVGMSVRDLSAKASDWTLVPMPDYKLIDLYSRTMPRIHFLVSDPAVTLTGEWSDYKIEQLNPEAAIHIIVVL
ncbi:MAG: hypothetical protein U0176_00845 [Bacteroidia bacterium]